MENVLITAPKTEVHQFTDNMSKIEVTSRLKNLANIMDSRGWASKDPRFQANVVLPTSPASDRLLDISQLPAMTQQSTDATQTDFMDETVSPLAAQFDDMITKTEKEHRQQAVSHMNDPNFNPYPVMTQNVISPSGTETKQKNKKKKPSTHKVATAPPPPVPDPALTKLVDNSGGLSVQTLASEAQRLKSLESGDEISLH